MTDRNISAQAVELTTATYDQVASNYAERHEDTREHWVERIEQFVDLLTENERQHPLLELGRPGDDISLAEYMNFVPVLDAGCGPGRDSRTLAAHDLPVLGVDISQGMLDAAIERTARRLPKGSIRYALMDLRRLELPDASCRGVWCSAALLHLPRHVAPRAVAELARVARSGGPLVVMLKRHEQGPAEEWVTYEYAGGGTLRRFFTYYTEDQAARMLADAGFELLETAIVPHDGGPNAPAWVSLLARKP